MNKLSMDHVVVIWTPLAVFGALRETLFFTQSKVLSFFLFLDTPCFQTLSVFEILLKSHSVQGIFLFSPVSGHFLRIKKCLENRKKPNPLKKSFFKEICLSPVTRHFLYSKVSRNRRNDPLKKLLFSKNFSVLDFWTSVGSGPLGAERCRRKVRHEKCTLPTIPLGPAGQGLV